MCFTITLTELLFCFGGLTNETTPHKCKINFFIKLSMCQFCQQQWFKLDKNNLIENKVIKMLDHKKQKCKHSKKKQKLFWCFSVKQLHALQLRGAEKCSYFILQYNIYIFIQRLELN